MCYCAKRIQLWTLMQNLFCCTSVQITVSKSSVYFSVFFIQKKSGSLFVSVLIQHKCNTGTELPNCGCTFWLELLFVPVCFWKLPLHIPDVKQTTHQHIQDFVVLTVDFLFFFFCKCRYCKYDQMSKSWVYWSLEFSINKTYKLLGIVWYFFKNRISYWIIIW